VKELTSNYTVSCLPPTTRTANTTIAPRNRTKNITPKWKLSRTDYYGSGLGLNKYHRKINNAVSLRKSIHIIEYLLFSFLFLLV
jgi:hypothetical protein